MAQRTGGEDERDPPATAMPKWVEDGTRAARSGGRGAGAGLEFGAAVVVFTLLGYWLDRRLGTLPLCLLLGLALGFGGGLVHLVRALGSTTARSGARRGPEEPPNGA